MRAGGGVGHEAQHLGHRRARADLRDDGRAHDAAIRDRGDRARGLGCRDAEAHDHRQVGRGLDARALQRYPQAPPDDAVILTLGCWAVFIWGLGLTLPLWPVWPVWPVFVG